MAPPSLLEKDSEQNAIDNLHKLGDVGKTHELRLRRVLPHATAEQLEHIETCSKGRDLSSITEELWRKHYGRRFGEDTADKVRQRMIKDRWKLKWRTLYKEKMKQEEQLQTKGVKRLRELYQEQDAKKASRKIHLIDMTPPEARKRGKTAMMPGSAGSSALPASSRLKKPASSKAAAMVTGWSSNKGQTEEQVQRESLKKGGPERGRLWRKSIKDHNQERLQKRRQTDSPVRVIRV